MKLHNFSSWKKFENDVALIIGTGEIHNYSKISRVASKTRGLPQTSSTSINPNSIDKTIPLHSIRIQWASTGLLKILAQIALKA
jgi:hypothetical protein